MSFSRLLSVCCVLGLLLGCTGNAMLPVQGTVMLDGQPLEGAAIGFIPAEGGRPATGKTDAQGHFTLASFTANDGLPPGSYKVTVTKVEVGRAAQAAPSSRDAEEAGGESTAMGRIDQGVKFLTPVKYSSPLTTDLVVEVGPGMEPVKLDLRSK